MRSDEDLDEVLRWKEHRTLTHNLTVHYGGTCTSRFVGDVGFARVGLYLSLSFS